MKTYTFFPVPSEHHNFIVMKNCTVYLNNTYLCSSAYSIILSYTILGKYFCVYNINGQKIYSIALPNSLEKISYKISAGSVFFETLIN